MNQKFFSLDKNYILKQAQAESKPHLLGTLVQSVISTYLLQYNPLGVEDDTIVRIKTCSYYHLEPLEIFYEELAGIYRYKFNEIQLEIIFDGRSHTEKYLQEWQETFFDWINEFLQNAAFLRAVLECSVLYPQDKNVQLAQARIKYFMTRYFELKVYRYKGIQSFKIA